MRDITRTLGATSRAAVAVSLTEEADLLEAVLIGTSRPGTRVRLELITATLTDAA
jgi:hypothetical protein